MAAPGTSLTLLLYRGMLVLSPLLLLGLVEGIFRVTGIGARPPLFKVIEQSERGTLLLTDRARPASFFFIARDRMSPIDPTPAWLPKPANTYRVLWVGESAAKGYPQPRGFAASSFFEAMLSDHLPSQDIEVINLAATAISSEVVRDLLTEGLILDPDLVVLYTGHNEFYGTQGVANRPRFLTLPAIHRVDRWMRSLALVQVIAERRGQRAPPDPRQHLMEWMGGNRNIAPDDPLRPRAASIFAHHLTEMIRHCRDHGVPVIVCTLPTNERDLRPIGEDDEAHSAHVSFAEGQRALDDGDAVRAGSSFRQARDLDPMPWRAPTLIQSALRHTAEREQAWLSDVEQAFIRQSPQGVIGWALMDDHVHPSLAGQVLIAQTVLETLIAHHPELRPGTGHEAAAYRSRLGENPYDAYGVAVTMQRLFNTGFLSASNPDAAVRFIDEATRLSASFTPRVRQAMQAWRLAPEQGVGRKPASGMAAAALLQDGRVEEAGGLFRIARRHAPPFTSWWLEFAFYDLVCAVQLRGSLDADERDVAEELLHQGEIMIRHGAAETGLTERYLGRTLQLLGRMEESIPWLERSREKVSGRDRLAVDHALITAYRETGRMDEARLILDEGLRQGGDTRSFYLRLAEEP